MDEFNSNSDFLFPASSFLTGMASVLDLGGNLVKFNISKTGEEADLKALSKDWEMVGKDLKFAVTKTISHGKSSPRKKSK